MTVVPLIYDRNEQDGRVQIEATRGWYVARYTTLPFLVAMVVFGPRLGRVGVIVCAVGLLVSLTVRIFGFWAANKELRAAMRRGVLKVSGSAWNYKHPLHYEFTRELPTATVVKHRS